MSQPLPNQYRTVPHAPAPVIPGSTRLVLIGAEQEELLELQIPPSTSALAPDIPLLPLIRARCMAEVAPPGLDPARVLFLVGYDARDIRRVEGPLTDDDSCESRELDSGDVIQVVKDPSPATKARMAAARLAITPETMAKAAAVAVQKAAAAAAASHQGPLQPTTP
jgi:hypothetical protein